ncbi:MAG: LysR substrate-binding domain-containing protein [Campylobacterales bacterium]
MNFTIRQLEIFKEVATTGHVTNSSEALGISQSAISMALQELESNLKTKFFERRNKKLILNENGRLLLERANRLLKEFEELENSFLENNISGKLRIGASQTIGDYIMPQLIYAFMQKYPDAKCELVVANTKDILAQLDGGEIDIGFIEGFVSDSKLDSKHWKDDELLVIASNKKKFSKDEYKLDELSNQKWILREKGSGTRAIFEDGLGDDFAKLNIFLTLGHNEAIKKIVEQSDSITCISRLAVQKEIDEGKLFEVKMKNFVFKRKLLRLLHKEKYQSKLLKSFMEFAEKF